MLTLDDPEIERHFQDYVRKGADERAVAEVLLGDASYVERLPMPKYNGPTTILREPSAAVRYAQRLGIPGSKSAHRQREEYFTALHATLKGAYDLLYTYCIGRYGSQGPIVSGIGRSHFPESAKERLRFLNQGINMADDARRLHLYLTKSRSPYFTW
jgi:hypothetical protein